MASSNMGKRPLVNESEFRSAGKKSGGGGLDKAGKIKAGASIVAILVAVGFLAFYFGLFGGAEPGGGGPIAENIPLTPEEVKQVEEIQQEQLDYAEQRGIPSVGS